MTLADFLAGALLFFVPLLWGALGALLSARSGVLPLGLEGMMIAGALGGCLFLSAVETAPEQPQRWMLAAMAIAGLSSPKVRRFPVMSTYPTMHAMAKASSLFWYSFIINYFW